MQGEIEQKMQQKTTETASSELQRQIQTQNRVGLAALMMSLGTMTSRVLGLVRESAFAALFPKEITDAWGAAFRLPNLFRRLLGEGSLSVSFIPVFVEAQNEDARNGTQEAKNLVNAFYSLLLVILTTLTVAGIVFAPEILNVLLDEVYKSDFAKFDLTLRMTRLMFSFVFLISTYAFFMGILNALGHFGLAALAPALWNISMIISTFIPPEYFPSPGDGLSYGVLMGGFLQAAVLVPLLRQKNFFPSWSWNPMHPKVKKIFRNLLPSLLGMGLLQISTLVNLHFASSLGEGVISYINYVDRLIELPLSLISVSLGTALLPTLSRFWVVDEKTIFAETLKKFLLINLFIALPCAIGLMILAEPIISILFQRGQFLASDVEMTALILQSYGVIMLVSSTVRVLTPAYYAVKNTWYPALTSALGLVAHFYMAPILMANFQVQGLMYSTILSAAINLLLLILGFSIFITRFDYWGFLKNLALFCIPAGVIYLSAYSYFFFLSFFASDYFFAKLSSLLLCFAVSAAAFMSVSTVLHIEEFESFEKNILKKILRKLKF